MNEFAKFITLVFQKEVSSVFFRNITDTCLWFSASLISVLFSVSFLFVCVSIHIHICVNITMFLKADTYS